MLKDVIKVLPIPHSTIVDLYCGGHDARLWFHTSATVDKDRNFTNGIEPAIDDVRFSMNLSHFKIPSEGRYVCKVSLNTYGNSDDLLLNICK